MQPALEPVRAGRRGSLRVLALALAAAAVLVVGGGLALGNLPSQPADLARYAAADSTLFVELRLDMPGDQRELLLDVLRHFPGFEDERALDRRIAAAFEKLGRRTGEDLSWERHVESWFGGRLAVFGSLPSDPDDDGRWVGAVSVRDPAAARRLIAGRASEAGLAESEYGTATLWQRSFDGERVVIGLTDDALLLADNEQDVRAAIDRADGDDNLSREQRFVAALAKLDRDRLATLYFDGDALQEVLRRDGAWSGLGTQPLDAMGGLVVGQLRAEGDHVALTMRSRPSGTAFPLPDNRSTGMAERMPAGSALYVEMRDVGPSIRRALQPMLDELEASGDDEGFLLQMETFLGTPLDEFFDFLDDVAVSAKVDGERYSGGLVATVTDEDTATERMRRLTGILRMAANAGMAPLQVTQEERDGINVTVIRLDGSEAGVPLGEMDLPSLSFALHDGHLYLGVDDFVTDALDRPADRSLATDSRFSSALSSLSGANAGTFYVDVDVARRLMEAYRGDMRSDRHMRQLWPYFERLDRLVSVSFVDGDELVTRTLLFVE